MVQVLGRFSDPVSVFDRLQEAARPIEQSILPDWRMDTTLRAVDAAWEGTALPVGSPAILDALQHDFCGGQAIACLDRLGMPLKLRNAPHQVVLPPWLLGHTCYPFSLFDTYLMSMPFCSISQECFAPS